MLSNQIGEDPVYKQLRELFLERIEKGELVPGDRTIDQMVQAARSGKQNIIKGAKASGVSSVEWQGQVWRNCWKTIRIICARMICRVVQG
jgi:hypothetical protein